MSSSFIINVHASSRGLLLIFLYDACKRLRARKINWEPLGYTSFVVSIRFFSLRTVIAFVMKTNGRCWILFTFGRCLRKKKIVSWILSCDTSCRCDLRDTDVFPARVFFHRARFRFIHPGRVILEWFFFSVFTIWFGNIVKNTINIFCTPYHRP